MTTRESYTRAKQLFLAACERPPELRARFLEEACGGDVELRREVEALLSYHKEGSPFVPEKDLEVRPLREANHFQAGDVFAGRYRIVCPLGHGGMGEVYRAEDLTLGVPVALKFLRAGGSRHREVLLNEVRLARQVSHPAVCRVFDVGEAEGQTFVTMEYIDGEDLASELRRIGRLPAAKVLELARELCAGLAAAHDRGVLHRDLKPANVMVDASGHARIVDFGIAISEGVPDPVLVGTPAYMAPEQLVPGRTTTAQTDLYALGLLLYEAVTGRPVFRAQTLAERRALQKSGALEPPPTWVEEIDARLEHVILEALQEEPRQRPASARAMSQALEESAQGDGAESPLAEPSAAEPRARARRLREIFSAKIAVASVAGLLMIGAGTIWLSGAAPLGLPLDSSGLSSDETKPTPADLSHRPSLIILPFANLSDDPAQEYLADGIAEDLTTALSRTRDLMVLARNTALTYKGRAVKPQDLRDELGVRYVVEGSVRREGDRIRVNAQLIDAKSGAHLWAEQYEGKLREVLEVQSEIVASVSSRLNIELLDAELRTVESREAEGLSAYEAYMKGQALYRRFDLDSLHEARGLFEVALQKDPNYADALAALGETYLLESSYFSTPPDLEKLEEGARLVRQAAQLDPFNSGIQRILGGIHVSRANALGQLGLYESARQEYAPALQAVERAVELAPSSAEAYMMVGVCQTGLGDYANAMTAFETALRLNPGIEQGHLFPVVWEFKGALHHRRGEIEEAISLWEQARSGSPSLLSRLRLIDQYERSGRDEFATRVTKEVLEIQPSLTADQAISYLNGFPPYPSQPEQTLANLRKAGLP